MHPDARQLTFVRYELLHPQLPRLVANEVAEFYALVHGLHPFESCVHSGDSGATIETEGWVTIDISRDGFTFSERVRDDFSVVRKRAVDVFDLAKTHFEIPVYIVSSVVLRQTWPAPDQGDMAQRLRDKVLSLTPEQYELLGEDVSAGVHFVGTTTNDAGRMHWHLEVDPSLAESTTLFMELRSHFSAPHATIDGVGESLDTARNFLEDNATKFVMNLLS